MKWKWMAGLLVLAGLMMSSSPDRDPPAESPDEGGCSTCGSHSHFDPPITRVEYMQLIERFGKGPLDETNQALETLLYHGRETEFFLSRDDLPCPPADHLAFLKKELTKTHGMVSFRIVDDEGVERVRLGPQKVPFGKKQHLHPETRLDVQDMDFSGTLKRVGLYHIWARF